MANQCATRNSTDGIRPLLEKLGLADPPTFTLFPKLPPELRLKILKDTLLIGPQRRRFIRVKARIDAPSRHSKKPCWFIIEDNECSADIKDIGLLRTNKESRDVYLRYFNKALRAKGEGLIRYHDDDIIFVCKYQSNLPQFPICPNLASASICFFVKDSTDHFTPLS
jgi:hypothetical protein